MHGNLKVETGSARPDVPVVDVTGEALLPTIQVNGGDAMP